jgi:hypothetical protein
LITAYGILRGSLRHCGILAGGAFIAFASAVAALTAITAVAAVPIAAIAAIPVIKCRHAIARHAAGSAARLQQRSLLRRDVGQLMALAPNGGLLGRTHSAAIRILGVKRSKAALGVAAINVNQVIAKHDDVTGALANIA